MEQTDAGPLLDMDGAADVGRTTYTPFRTELPGAAPVRLIVQEAGGSPRARFPTGPLRHLQHVAGHRTGTERPWNWSLPDHRRHALLRERQFVGPRKYGVGLNHMPSRGRFAANGAWLAVQVMAHNLARWTARIELGEQIATTKTLRSDGSSPGWPDGSRRSACRRLTLHLPQRGLGNPVQSRPATLRAIPASQPDGARPQLTRHPPNPTSPQVPAVQVREHLWPAVLSPASRPTRTSSQTVGHGLAVCSEGRHLLGLPFPGESVPGPSPPFAPHHPFCCCNVIPSVDSGLGVVPSSPDAYLRSD